MLLDNTVMTRSIMTPTNAKLRNAVSRTLTKLQPSNLPFAAPALPRPNVNHVPTLVSLMPFATAVVCKDTSARIAPKSMTSHLTNGLSDAPLAPSRTKMALQAPNSRTTTLDDDDSTIQSTRSNDSNAQNTPTPSTNCRSGTPGRQRSRVGWQNFQFFNMMTNPIVNDPAHVHTQSPQCDNSTSLTSLRRQMILLRTLSFWTLVPASQEPLPTLTLFSNVRPAKQKIGMQTNAGHSILDVQADVPDFGSVYYDSNHVANIFGFAHLVDNVDYITYDSRIADAFHVHTKSGKTTFECTDQNLYAYQPKRGYLNAIAESKHMVPPPDVSGTVSAQSLACFDDAFDFLMTRDTTVPIYEHSHLISSVEENKLPYTDRQVKDAKLARILFHGGGRPSPANLKFICKTGWIKNNPVLTEDVIRATHIWGSDCSDLKGKSVRPHPPCVRAADVFEIPPEIKETHNPLTLSIDLIYICGMPMLTSIDHTIKYRCLIPLASRNAPELYSALDKIYRLYNHAGFEIDPIHADNEFRPLMEDALDTNRSWCEASHTSTAK